MSSLPSSVEDELHKFLKLFVPNAILLRNKVEPSTLNDKVEHVKDELQKPTVNVKV
jgi:exo-beta-1,3-glucanase (GH17 family)